MIGRWKGGGVESAGMAWLRGGNLWDAGVQDAGEGGEKNSYQQWGAEWEKSCIFAT